MVTNNSEGRLEYTITGYSIAKKDLYVKVPDEEYYDLLEVVIIRLGKDKNRTKGIAKGRAEGIAKGMAKGIEKGRAEGKAEGMLETLVSLVLKGSITKEEAAQTAGMNEKEFEEILSSARK